MRFKLLAFAAYLGIGLCNLSIAQQSSKSEFGEQAAIYVGSCLGQEYLKRKHCPSVSAIDHRSCIASAELLLPQRLRSEFRRAIAQNDLEMHMIISSAIDRGYEKSVSLLNGDKTAACSNYAAIMKTAASLKFEELERIGARLK
jgi:hypothetical protein